MPLINSRISNPTQWAKSEKKVQCNNFVVGQIQRALKNLHWIIGFLSIFPKKSSLWISQNPCSKFWKLQKSAHISAQPKTANSAQNSDKDYYARTFFLIISHWSHVITFLQKSKFGDITKQVLRDQNGRSCLKPMKLGLQLCSNYIAAIWRTF